MRRPPALVEESPEAPGWMEIDGQPMFVVDFTPARLPIGISPWVESQLAARGIPTVPWTYVADENRFSVVRQLDTGPVVLRASRSTGGVGIVLAQQAEQVDLDWPRRQESLVSVAPYLAKAIPLNATGCVFDDGTITVYPLSVQLVGLEVATLRPYFGYCGNDFGAARRLELRVLDQVQDVIDGVGAWLPFEAEAANLFFQLVASRYERASVIVTSNSHLQVDGARSSATPSSPRFSCSQRGPPRQPREDSTACGGSVLLSSLSS